MGCAGCCVTEGWAPRRQQSHLKILHSWPNSLFTLLSLNTIQLFDDVSFEKQSALFALAIADIVLINMWCHDISRENASNKPLLRTVFEVMTHLFSPRKTTLMFVLRDKNKIPFEHLERSLTTDIEKIWNEIPKHQDRINTPLSQFFNVVVYALSNYEEKEELFMQEIGELKNRLTHSISPQGLAADRKGVLPASAFPSGAQQIWKVIKENKNLNLPALKYRIAKRQCEDIANEKLNRFNSDKDWLSLKEAIQTRPVSNFGHTLGSILQTYLSEYNLEATYFEKDVRDATRWQLITNALNLIRPTYNKMLEHIYLRAFEIMKTMLAKSLRNAEDFDASITTCYDICMHEFDKGCEDCTVEDITWNSSKVRVKLHKDITEYANLSKLYCTFKTKLAEKICKPVKYLIEAGGENTWIETRKLVKIVTGNAELEFSSEINKSGFSSDQATVNSMMQNLHIYARNLVQLTAKDLSEKVVEMMVERFSKIFYSIFDKRAKILTGKKKIKEIANDARIQPLKLLALIAVIRLDEETDTIEEEILSSFGEWNSGPSPNLCSNTWNNVSENDTLIPPYECNNLWEQFVKETDCIVSKVYSECKQRRRVVGEHATGIIVSASLLMAKLYMRGDFVGGMEDVVDIFDHVLKLG